MSSAINTISNTSPILQQIAGVFLDSRVQGTMIAIASTVFNIFYLKNEEINQLIEEKKQLIKAFDASNKLASEERSRILDQIRDKKINIDPETIPTAAVLDTSNLIETTGRLSALWKDLFQCYATKTENNIEIASLKITSKEDHSESEKKFNNLHSEKEELNNKLLKQKEILDKECDAMKASLKNTLDSKEKLLNKEFQSKEESLKKEYNDKENALKTEYNDKETALKTECTVKENSLKKEIQDISLKDIDLKYDAQKCKRAWFCV